jgi:hypothetical protein
MSAHKPAPNHHHHQQPQQSNQNQIMGPDNFAMSNGLNGSSSTSVAHGLQANVPPAKRAKTSKKVCWTMALTSFNQQLGQVMIIKKSGENKIFDTDFHEAI